MTWTFGRIGVPSPTVFTDDFERTDGTLDDNGWIPAGIYPIGSSVENSTRHLQIVSGKATLALTGAGYAIRNVRGFRKATVTMEWAAGSTDGSFVGVVCSKVDTAEGIVDIGIRSVHAVVGRTARSLNLYNGSLSAAVDTDTYTISTGTEVTFSIEWDGANTLTITDVDGGTETYTSSLVGSLWGDTVYIEVLNQDASTDRIASMVSVVLEGDSTIALEGHEPPAWDGDELTLQADIPAATITDAIALRDQFNGYDLNRDEDIVPITSTEDPTIDGFYRVTQVAVDDTIGTYLSGGIGSRVQIEATKVDGFAAPLVEVIRNGAIRSNSHSNTNDFVAVTGLPGGFKTPRFTVAQDAEANVPVEGGSVRVYADSTVPMSVTYGIVPDSFYEGATTIEVSYDEGSSWWPVVGRQVRNLPGFIRLGNGRVRVTCSLSGGATLLATEVWDPTAGRWERCDFNVTDSGSPTTVATYTHSGAVKIIGPIGIAEGPDGNLWFTSSLNDRIWRVTPGGVLSAFAGTNIDAPQGITSGPDGLLWFTSQDNDRIGKITTTGTVTTYTTANISEPLSICEGPDGLLWFTSYANDRIGKITTSGTVTTYTDANIDGPWSICEGPDGLLWFASSANDRIGKITTSGTVTTYTDANISGPIGITSGPDGLLWFTSAGNDRIGKITTTGTVTTYTTDVPNAPRYICSDGTDLWFTYDSGIGRSTTPRGSSPRTATSGSRRTATTGSECSTRPRGSPAPLSSAARSPCSATAPNRSASAWVRPTDPRCWTSPSAEGRTSSRATSSHPPPRRTGSSAPNPRPARPSPEGSKPTPPTVTGTSSRSSHRARSPRTPPASAGSCSPRGRRRSPSP